VSDLAKLLLIVDPAGIILKEWKMDDVRDWYQLSLVDVFVTGRTES
jgi:hypothetical protein